MDLKTYAERLLDATNGWFPFAIDPTAVTTKELALAGIVRCRRLLEGMILVHDAPDLGGLFARALYETYLSTAYLLFGGDSAFERLQKNDNHEHRRFAKRFVKAPAPDHANAANLLAQSKAVLESPEASGAPIDTARLAEEVKSLLSAVGDPNGEWVVSMYWALYSPDSYTTVHGGLGAIKQYLLEKGEVMPRISADSWHHDGNDRRLEMMTSALLGLACEVGTALGLPIGELDDLEREWCEDRNAGRDGA